MSRVYEVASERHQQREGFAVTEGIVHGDGPPTLSFVESGVRFEVAAPGSVGGGQKTGYYFDQRENRAAAAGRANGARVLDAFCYDGLFAIRAALAGAAHVVGLDQSEKALDRARRNAERNGVLDRVRFERADCMQDLRDRARAGERYGVVVLDPPAFARNRAEVAGAERGYVELNRRGFELVDDGGTLVSASCSFNVRTADFTGWIARAAHLAGVDAWLDDLRGAPADHPVLMTLPESSYLKCVYARVGRG